MANGGEPFGMIWIQKGHFHQTVESWRVSHARHRDALMARFTAGRIVAYS
jgi:hypothetical protein